MAEASDIAQVRRFVQEPDGSNGYTDEILGPLIDAHGVRGAAAVVWEEKAAKWASLVDTKEGSSSRDMSQMYEHALKMRNEFSRGEPEPTMGRTRVHEIER